MLKSPIEVYLSEKHLSQRALAENDEYRLLTQATISRFNRNGNISACNLYLLSKVTGISADILTEYAFKKTRLINENLENNLEIPA